MGGNRGGRLSQGADSSTPWDPQVGDRWSRFNPFQSLRRARMAPFVDYRTGSLRESRWCATGSR
eukprot:8248338-Pyramimonas_sp.AAC.1